MLKQVAAVHLDAAGVGLDQAEDTLQQHGLAAAGAADDDHGGAGHDVEVDAVQHLFGAERLAESADADLGGFGRRHWMKNSSVRT